MPIPDSPDNQRCETPLCHHTRSVHRIFTERERFGRCQMYVCACDEFRPPRQRGGFEPQEAPESAEPPPVAPSSP